MSVKVVFAVHNSLGFRQAPCTKQMKLNPFKFNFSITEKPNNWKLNDWINQWMSWVNQRNLKQKEHSLYYFSIKHRVTVAVFCP